MSRGVYKKSPEHCAALSAAKSGICTSPGSTFKAGHKTNVGRIVSAETRRKIAVGHMKPKPVCIDCGVVVSTRKTLRCIACAAQKRNVLRGESSNFWRGGKTKERAKIYNSLEYKNWRRGVFKRDDWRCVWCGERGGKIQADHIKPFAYFPELRFELSNGRTLCIECHRKTDTYGNRYARTLHRVV